MRTHTKHLCTTLVRQEHDAAEVGDHTSGVQRGRPISTHGVVLRDFSPHHNTRYSPDSEEQVYFGSNFINAASPCTLHLDYCAARFYAVYYYTCRFTMYHHPSLQRVCSLHFVKGIFALFQGACWQSVRVSGITAPFRARAPQLAFPASRHTQKPKISKALPRTFHSYLPDNPTAN